jgi:hypothetical protein
VEDLLAPTGEQRSFEYLFTDVAIARIQDPGECHEYKKKSGSSDAAKTYDTISI